MIKTLTTNVVKGKFFGKDGKPSGREYTFYIDEDVLVGARSRFLPADAIPML